MLTYALFPEIGLRFLEHRGDPSAFEPPPGAGNAGQGLGTAAGRGGTERRGALHRDRQRPRLRRQVSSGGTVEHVAPAAVPATQQQPQQAAQPAPKAAANGSGVNRTARGHDPAYSRGPRTASGVRSSARRARSHEDGSRSARGAGRHRCPTRRQGRRGGRRRPNTRTTRPEDRNGKPARSFGTRPVSRTSASVRSS